jgi:hypothetical protein
VRADDPRVGRCISRDPLGRAPLCFADQPYAYAGNNPLIHVDPSGQRRRMRDGGDWVTAAPVTHTAHWGRHARNVARVYMSFCNRGCWSNRAKGVASRASSILAITGGVYAGLALGAMALASLLTSDVLPWALGMAMATGITGFGLAFWMTIAAVATGAALVLRQAADQLTVAAAAAETLAGIFGLAASQDQLSYGYVTGGWKLSIVGVLAAFTIGQYVTALVRGFKAIATAIESIARLLDGAVVRQVMSLLTILSADGTTMLSAGWLAHVSFGAISEMEGELR